jgi:Ser/Thr protein kinase RdoA (MazF antagonist)
MHNQVQSILQVHYGLMADDIQLIRTVGGGIKAISRVVCGGRAYVLKRFRLDYRSLADVIAMHDAQDYLRAAGLPMATTVANRDGLPVTPDAGGDGGVLAEAADSHADASHAAQAQPGVAPGQPPAPGYAWVLYNWLPGHHIQPGINMTPRAAAALGETVARLAQVLKHWPTTWPGAEPTQLDPPAERIALYEDLLRHAEGDPTPLGATCRQALKERLRGIHHLAHIAPQLVSMERQWVHGDMNEGNVFFFDDDQITAIIDFDNIRRSPRGFDFMYALTSFFPTRATEGQVRDAYARAWLQVARPTQAELALLPALWAYRQLCDVWPIDEYYLRPDTYPAWPIDPPDTWWEIERERTTDWLMSIC